jgi:heptosyltransferase-2
MTTRILLVKVAALGDAVMASTILPAVHARWPGAELTWVAGRAVAPLARLFEGVHRVVEVNERKLLRGGVFARVGALARAWRDIGRGYDVALVAHSDARYGMLAWWCAARHVRRVSVGAGNARGRWHGDAYAWLAGDGDTWGPRASGARYGLLKRELLPPAPPVGGTGPLVVVAPGGARNVLRDDALRRWPLERWTALVRSLAGSGARVVAVGGPEDAAEGAACAAAGATDLTGRTTVETLLSLLSASACVVSHDSGVLHLALLVRAPVVALFGPTRAEGRIPPGARATVLSAAPGLACAPCYDGFAYAPCARNACLADVSVEEVASAVRAQLGVNASPAP